MPDGILIIDKPQDWTSMDVCAKLRGGSPKRAAPFSGAPRPFHFPGGSEFRRGKILPDGKMLVRRFAAA